MTQKYDTDPFIPGSETLELVGGIDSEGRADVLATWPAQGNPSVYEGTVTASGDTTVITPTSGKAIRVFWVSIQPDPDTDPTPRSRLLIGANGKYRVYFTQHKERFDGAADEAVIINLSAAGTVAVTIHFEEYTP